MLLYAEFFKTGLFAVGGGLATLPFLFQMADRYGLLNRETVGNFLAVAQSSPGPVGVNMAAQTGFRYGGIAGACIAALGLVSPAILIINVIARMLRSFKESKTAVSVFAGLRPAACGLLAAAGLGVWKLALYKPDAAAWYELLRWKETLIFAALFLAIRKCKRHPAVYIAAGAILGITLGM
ncbi:MAG: chromate transporter [Treponema sp.]|nr:chromate transporter [Treponema sp.]